MALPIPSMVLKQLYTFNSLRNTADGVRFSLKNRLSDTKVTALQSVKFDGEAVPRENISILLDTGEMLNPDALAQQPVDFPLRKMMDVICRIEPLSDGIHKLEIKFSAENFGDLTLKVDSAVSTEVERAIKIPRSSADNYSDEIIKERQKFVEEFTGKKLEHISQYSFDPHITGGNIENFTGVAQVPLGFAGPLTIRGEHAQGDFIIPMATAEGTLVASYNRGMKILNLSGGVEVTVIGDAMQRAPVFVFDDARGARNFVKWVQETIDKIREEAEATSSVAKLAYIDPYLAGKFAFLRFNFTTGDAAGQNMVGRATFAASSWILDNYDGIRHFYLESNLATDKKASQVNVMHTRGKRGRRRSHGQAGNSDPTHARQAGAAFLPLQRRQHRDDPLRRQQQWRTLGQRHHRHVHRDRTGRGQRRRVVGWHFVHGADRRRRSVHGVDDPFADRGNPRRRHQPRNATRVLGAAGLLWPRHRLQARRDHRCGGLGRRDLARSGDLVVGLGVEP